MIRVDTELDLNYIANYMLYNIYMGKVGIIAVILGALDIGFAVRFYQNKKIPLVVLSAIFVVVIFIVIPFIINMVVSKKAAQSKMVGAKATYEFSDEGVRTTTEYDSGLASWKRFSKVFRRKDVLVIRADTGQDLLVPIPQIGEQFDALIDLFYANMPAPNVRIMKKPKKSDKNETNNN
ncbi:MAG: YcxB family protein [Lachnospiraceae bacterium]|jgi:hypothetical protein|nr:YcxB family protein [Lachnospiraceae bacterium]